jgi:hypothetical protein
VGFGVSAFKGFENASDAAGGGFAEAASAGEGNIARDATSSLPHHKDLGRYAPPTDFGNVSSWPRSV